MTDFWKVFKAWNSRGCHAIQFLLIPTETAWVLMTSRWSIRRLSNGSQLEPGFPTHQMCSTCLQMSHSLIWIWQNWECSGRKCSTTLLSQPPIAVSSVLPDILCYQMNVTRSVLFFGCCFFNLIELYLLSMICPGWDLVKFTPSHYAVFALSNHAVFFLVVVAFSKPTACLWSWAQHNISEI